MPIQPTGSSDPAVEQVHLRPCDEAAYAPRKATKEYSSTSPQARDAKPDETPQTAKNISDPHVQLVILSLCTVKFLPEGVCRP